MRLALNPRARKEKAKKVKQVKTLIVKRPGYQRRRIILLRRRRMKERLSSKTPSFWRKIGNIGLAIGGIGAVLVTQGAAVPIFGVIAPYFIAAGGVAATLSQFAKENE